MLYAHVRPCLRKRRGGKTELEARASSGLRTWSRLWQTHTQTVRRTRRPATLPLPPPPPRRTTTLGEHRCTVGTLPKNFLTLSFFYYCLTFICALSFLLVLNNSFLFLFLYSLPHAHTHTHTHTHTHNRTKQWPNSHRRANARLQRAGEDVRVRCMRHILRKKRRMVPNGVHKSERVHAHPQSDALLPRPSQQHPKRKGSNLRAVHLHQHRHHPLLGVESWLHLRVSRAAML